MNIAVAGDSAGEGLAHIITEHLKAKNLTANDVSKSSENPEPFYANLSDRVANSVISGEYDRAILVCGTGIGVCLSANKVPGIRAAQCHDTYSAERAALSNNAQIITLGARVVGPELAKAIVDSFLANTFDENGRSAGNVNAINELDVKYKK